MRTIFTLNLLSEDQSKRPNTLSYTHPATRGIPISHQILQILVRLLCLILTLARGKFWGSCNWDPWALHIALHASRNVPWRLRRLETVQAIEHSVVVNGCKNSSNSYYWSQVTTLLIRRSIAIHSLWHTVEVLPQAHAPNNPILRYLFNPSFDKWIDKHEVPCYCHLKKITNYYLLCTLSELQMTQNPLQKKESMQCAQSHGVHKSAFFRSVGYFSVVLVLKHLAMNRITQINNIKQCLPDQRKHWEFNLALVHMNEYISHY